MAIDTTACEAIHGAMFHAGLGMDLPQPDGAGDDRFQHILGSFACLLVLATFSMPSMRSLRTVAIASNLAFIGYAWLLGLWPILMLHSILLPLNGFRLAQIELARRPPQRHPMAPADGAGRCWFDPRFPGCPRRP